MTNRVYLGHLSRDTSDRDIKRLFKNYGTIREVTLKNGFGFVDFDDSRDADDVVNDFHGKHFLGERLIVEFARSGSRWDDRRYDRFGPPERTEYRLMVENLAHGVSWQDKLQSFLGSKRRISPLGMVSLPRLGALLFQQSPALSIYNR
ncbi:hypothetical protein BGW39_003446 [Mortierella sp. 14UC]|nr:hypothetical protein BGW39_003446 [Mortierella sp. 14UC]